MVIWKGVCTISLHYYIVLISVYVGRIWQSRWSATNQLFHFLSLPKVGCIERTIKVRLEENLQPPLRSRANYSINLFYNTLLVFSLQVDVFSIFLSACICLQSHMIDRPRNDSLVASHSSFFSTVQLKSNILEIDSQHIQKTHHCSEHAKSLRRV